MFNEVDLETMRRLRRAIDPNELSNRGKMFLDDQASALRYSGPHPLEPERVISRA
jgi:glycolate oxidase